MVAVVAALPRQHGADAAFRAEQQQVEAAGELVQLRRWTEAGVLLQEFLSRPARTLHLRTQALIYLASVLARYHRFGDAIAVQEHLLDNELVEGGTAFGLRLGRAMAMLREDHLFDADRAISDLRRTGRPPTSGRREAGGGPPLSRLRESRRPPAEPSRSSKEAHGPRNARHASRRYALVAALRLLAARAKRVTVRTGDAPGAAAERSRRYPDVQKLEAKYDPAVAPPEALRLCSLCIGKYACVVQQNPGRGLALPPAVRRLWADAKGKRVRRRSATRRNAALRGHQATSRRQPALMNDDTGSVCMHPRKQVSSECQAEPPSSLDATSRWARVNSCWPPRSSRSVVIRPWSRPTWTQPSHSSSRRRLCPQRRQRQARSAAGSSA